MYIFERKKQPCPITTQATTPISKPTNSIKSNLATSNQVSSSFSINSSESLKLPLQFKAMHLASKVQSSPAKLQHLAAQGVQGPSQKLPHFERLQAAFKPYDLSQVKAYTGSRIASIGRVMGAKAYATGSKVAFTDSQPDLHTVAHEVAHVIQQQKGVQLKGGVGQKGDPYERQADQIADVCVKGQQVSHLISPLSTNVSSQAPLGQSLQLMETNTKQERKYNLRSGQPRMVLKDQELKVASEYTNNELGSIVRDELDMGQNKIEHMDALANKALSIVNSWETFINASNDKEQYKNYTTMIKRIKKSIDAQLNASPGLKPNYLRVTAIVYDAKGNPQAVARIQPFTEQADIDLADIVGNPDQTTRVSGVAKFLLADLAKSAIERSSSLNETIEKGNQSGLVSRYISFLGTSLVKPRIFLNALNQEVQKTWLNHKFDYAD